MKNIFSKVLLGLGLVLTVPQVAYSQSNFVSLQQDQYGHGTLDPEDIGRFSYTVPANTWGVFTLKNTGRASDLDIYIYNSNGNRVASGRKSGTTTELVVTDPVNRTQTFYAVIENYGGNRSSYKLNVDYVDPVARFLRVLAEEAISGGLSYGQDVQSSENIDRGVTAISSLMQGNSFGGVARDAAIREFTSYANSQVGGTVWGGLIVDWGASIISGFYEDYY